MSQYIRFTVALLLLCVAQVSYAVGITANADRTTVGLGEEVVLTVTVTGTTSVAPKFPELDGFDVRNGGQSSQFTMVDGSTSSEKSFTYFLRPRNAGLVTVGSFTVEVAGRIYASVPFQVQVKKERPVTPEQDKLAYIEVSVSTDSPVVGEPVIWTFRLLHRVQISNPSLEIEAFDGLSVSDLGEQTNYRTTIDGMSWDVVELQKRLVSSRVGAIVLPSPAMPLDLLIPDGSRRRRGLFSSMGGFKRKSVRLTTGTVTLNVRAIPTPPKGFSGLVGVFSMRSDLSKMELGVGEATTLTMRVRSAQPMLAIPAPIGEQLADVKTYESADPLLERGRTFRVDMVPQRAGSVITPHYQLITFDPAKGQYETHTAGPYRLIVTGNSDSDALNLASDGGLSPQKDRVEILADDIRHLRDFGSVDALRVLRTDTVMAGMLVPPFLFVGFSAYVRRRERLEHDIGWARKRAAVSKAKRALAASSTPEERAQVLRTAVGDLFNIEGGALTSDEVEQFLMAVPEPIRASVVVALRSFEAAQYAGSTASTPDAPSVLAVVCSLEAALS